MTPYVKNWIVTDLSFFGWYIHLQNIRFVLKIKFQRYEMLVLLYFNKYKTHVVFFTFRATLTFLLMNALVYDKEHRLGHS